MTDEKLTVKQELFVEAYTSNGFNASAAARQAGYSENTAGSIGNENLKKPQIKAAISEKISETAERLGAGREWRIEMLKKVAEAAYNGQASKDGLVHPVGVINAISELNKMGGDYEKTKDDSEPASISDVKNLLDKYRKDT